LRKNDPKKLFEKKAFFEKLWDIDAWFDTSVYQFFARLSDWWSAYASRIDRWHITGFRRLCVDVLGDCFTFALIFVFGLAYFAIPPVTDEENIWNKGRKYAITFTDRDGKFIGRRGVLQNDSIPLEDMPTQMINATLAIEDHRFHYHFGIDFLGTLRALVTNIRANDIVQGGSTLSQQLAKNLFLSPERTIKRKLHEAMLAFWIEARLSKKEILKLYLDRVYLGGGTYGVEAAAQYYFGKSVKDVTLAESAMLAGLYKAPSRYAPHINIALSRQRASVVLDRMVDHGYVSKGDAYAAKRNPAEPTLSTTTSHPNYFLDWAYDDVIKTIKAHKLDKEYVLVVRTTLDSDNYYQSRQAVHDNLEAYGKYYNVQQAALVSMTHTGAIRSLIGGKNYDQSQFNRATRAKRQPGSSFKPLVYMTALKHGYTPETKVTDKPIRIGNWSPRNYGRSHRGSVSLTTALKKSINTIPVRIAHKIGRSEVVKTAKDIGMTSKIGTHKTMPLGTYEVTVLDLTRAYATFASGGRKVIPHAVIDMRLPGGELVYSRERDGPKPVQVLDRKNAADLNYMLSQVVLSGTGRRANLGNIPVSGKTGTTQAYRDAWFMGYTADLVTGVWYGNDNFSSTKRLTGGRLPAMTWYDYMSRAQSSLVPRGYAGVPLSDIYTSAQPRILNQKTAANAGSETRAINPAYQVLTSLNDNFNQALNLSIKPNAQNTTPQATRNLSQKRKTVKVISGGTPRWSTQTPTVRFNIRKRLTN